MRKLACSCAAFAAAVFAAHYAVPENWYIYCAAACAVLALMAVPARGKRRLSLPLILLSAAAGFTCCFVQYIAVLRPAQALSGQTLRVTAVVTDFSVRYDNGASAAEVRLAGAAPHAEARIYDYDGLLPALEPGDTIELMVRACEKRPVALAQLEKIADDIEQELQGSLEREVSTKDIGEMVMRRPAPTPRSIVGEDGRCVFGTFSEEFQDLGLTSARRPTGAPQFMNRLKLTRWEASEICFRDGVLLSGVCNMEP